MIVELLFSVLPTLVGSGYHRPSLRCIRPVLHATRPPLILPVYIQIKFVQLCAGCYIVYLAIFFLRPMGHGSSHARSRSTRLRAMIESSENVHYIELSNLWVGRGKLKACARVRACVLCIQVFYLNFFYAKLFLTCTSRQHYTVMYNSAFFVCFWNRG